MEAKSNIERRKRGQSHILPPGNIASTDYIHFQFRNRDLSRCKQYTGDEDDEDGHSEEEKENNVVDDKGNEKNNSNERNQKRKSVNADAPRKGACSLSDYAANMNSRMLYHLQHYDNKQNENDNDRVVIEAAFT